MIEALPDLLKDGGYKLYVKHGEATVGEDQANLDLENCFTQRNLSEMGRRQAIYYGEIIRYLQIPISYPVRSSPFCRAIETAQFAFGAANVLIEPFWFQIYKLSNNLPVLEQQKILNSLQSVLEIKPAQRSNEVIIAHSFPNELGLGEIPDMGTVIIKPLGQGNGYEIISRLSFADLVGGPGVIAGW